MSTQPWWEPFYRDHDHETFGPVGPEFDELAERLPTGATVLDAGCGDGRHALHFARRAMAVSAFDCSSAGIDKLDAIASREQLPVRSWVADIRDVELGGGFDLLICHGVLQMVSRAERAVAVAALQQHTNPGGWNLVTVVVRDSEPDPLSPDPPVEGEIAELYAGWRIESARSYLAPCPHGGTPHQHPMNKVIARRP